jgi:hypothetical protein
MATQPDLSVDRLGAIYCGIMDSVAVRLSAIADALTEVHGDAGNQRNWERCEFCYLQVRKTIEYIALALLSAHKVGRYDCEALENHYKADVIFHDLGKLNPHGFPTAVQVEPAIEDGGAHHIAEVPSLSKRRMKRIYDDCAVHLHSGTLDSILRQEIPPYDLDRVAAWRTEIETLLIQHRVVLPHRGLVMLVTLRDAQTGRAQVTFLQADGPFQVQGDPAIYNDIPQ